MVRERSPKGLLIVIAAVACLAIVLRQSSTAESRLSASRRSASRLSASRFSAALHSITVGDLHQHVSTLADDVFEGRLAGSRGGRAAGNYIVAQIEQYGLTPAGEEGSYFQPCDKGYRNILAILPGSDPALADEIVVVSAHYDHIGYGDKKTSFGPIGYIHNGADDNASGVSAVLETVEALQAGNIRPRRSILFAFWDGEELGLIGSTHWVENPTLPLDRIKLMLNVDMIGWMREGRLGLDGSRSGYGMRRLLSEAVDEAMWLDFGWKLPPNTDHWPFYQQKIPVVTLHTGLHDHYHRPTDDVERLNEPGLEMIGRYLFQVVSKAASADQLPAHRPAAENESERTQHEVERVAPPVPPRIGISWRADDVQRLLVTNVIDGSPAQRAGLRTSDHLIAIDGVPLLDSPSLHLTLLQVAGPFTLTLRRDEQPQTIEAIVKPVGNPIRLGVSWHSDEAEPGTALLTKVVPGSPAAVAGLEILDRIYEVDDQPFANEDDLSQLIVGKLDANVQEIRFLTERRGHIQSVVVRLGPERVE